jgi:hypothetical protein
MKKPLKQLLEDIRNFGEHEKTSETTFGGHQELLEGMKKEQIFKPKDSMIRTNHVVQIKKF